MLSTVASSAFLIGAGVVVIVAEVAFIVFALWFGIVEEELIVRRWRKG